MATTDTVFDYSGGNPASLVPRQDPNTLSIIQRLRREAAAREAGPLEVSPAQRPAPAVAPVKVPTPTPGEVVAGSLTPQPSRLLAIHEDGLAQIARDDAARRQAQSAALQGRRERLAEIGRLFGAAALPEPPPSEAVPEPPQLRTRPFMAIGPDDDGMQAATKMLHMLGLAAMMFAGPATTALHAYSGALKGWAAGERENAERQWREYLANVERVKLENDRKRQDYIMLIQKHGHDLERLKSELGIAVAQTEVDEKLALLATQDPETAIKLLDSRVGFANQLYTNAFKLELDRQRALETERHHQATEQLARERLALDREIAAAMEAYRNRALEIAAAKAQPGSQDYKTYIEPMQKLQNFNNSLRRLSDLAERMNAKGLLSHRNDWVSLEAHKKKIDYLHAGDPDVLTWKQHINPAIIGEWERGLKDEKGIRAIAVFRENLKLPEFFFSYPGIRQFLDSLIDEVRIAAQQRAQLAIVGMQSPEARMQLELVLRSLDFDKPNKPLTPDETANRILKKLGLE